MLHWCCYSQLVKLQVCSLE
uniref:Uncharacterized protein n=1 Tax=Rhizophora mucronata TaxID=61149 RepID=A0A2P2R4C7_RHIMU